MNTGGIGAILWGGEEADGNQFALYDG